MESKILQLLFTNRKAWESTKELISFKELSPTGQILFKEIGEYYGNDPDAQSCDQEIILSKLGRKSPKALEIFRQLIGSFQTTQVSEANVLKEIYSYKQYQVGLSLASALTNQSATNVEELIDEYREFTELQRSGGTDTERVLVTGVSSATPVVELASAFKDGNLFRLYPNNFNAHVGGGVPPETHIVVYARPEMGKSAFVINQACMSARDGLRVLLVDNEDPMASTMMRIVNRLSGMNKHQVIEDPAKAEEIALSKGYANIFMPKEVPQTFRELEALVELVQPQILIVNQIRHIHIHGVDGEVQQLTAAGKKMRELIKKHHLVGISVHQAGDSATNKSVLDAGDVYMSNTSLPGDADILLGIGANPDMMDKGIRMLSLAKNKINGNHEPVSCIFDETLSMFKSL